MNELLIITGEVEKDKVSLQEFLDKNLQTFTFPKLHENGEGRKIWSALFTQINNASCSSIRLLYLTVLRILSRDKIYLDEALCPDGIETLLKLSGLNQNVALDNINDDCLLEALKCLCNLVFNNAIAQTYCARSAAVDGLFMRLRTYGDTKLPAEVKYFYMKLLFVLTALCAEVRPKILSECHGLIYLIEALDLILKNSTRVDCPTVILSDDQVMLACEILKILFNLSMHNTVPMSEPEEDNHTHYQRLVAILHDLLLCETITIGKTNELQTQTVNLLTSIPSDCYGVLLTPMVENCLQIQKDMEYKGKNMSAVGALLTYLSSKLENVQNVQLLHEQLSPILTVLLKAVRADPIIRKFLKSIILPPLTDVLNRPETGNSLRNHLCRLLTTPITVVRDLAAEFIFVLCKENVARMIKYTGYGNAAGLFANRGLTGQSDLEQQYSSDSDSDTEEYLAAASSINPVTGHCEPIQTNPTAHMSEEQKEFEAMELVKLIDQLSKGGIVKPCRIGTDGKPEPVEHVLQLQKELPLKQDLYKK